MNAIVTVSPSAVVPATANEIKAHVQRIQQVMRAVMKDKTHYGIVPGTPKPSLWKPGAEVLCATFHIAPSYRIDDLSDGDCIRYRVTCVGTHQGTGIVLGEGMGECSSNEEKYKWKATYNQKEFEATDDSRKRFKYGYDREKRTEYEIRQIRVEPADVANTVLKMACKRAQVAMTLNVVAASDIFTQDLEDLPEDIRETVGGDDPARQERRQPTQAPRSTASNSGGGQQSGGGLATEKQIKLIRAKMDQAGMNAEDFCKHFNIDSVTKLPFDRVNDALKFIADPQFAESGSQSRDPGQDD